MQAKLRKKWDCYKPSEGTYTKMQNENDKANQERAEECDIGRMIQKYGIMSFELLNQAKENLYLDMRGDSMTLNERMKELKKIYEYFENLPAKVRKNYGDSKETFYQSLLIGDYSKLIADNIFSQEQADNYTAIRQEKQTKYQAMVEQVAQLQNQLTQLKGEIDNGNEMGSI